MQQRAEDTVTHACAGCGAVNRIPRRRLADDPVCGRCHGKVFPRRPVKVSESTWRREVEQSPLPVLVDFWAAWCAPCRAVAPALEAVAAQRAGRVKVAKVNVDENPRLASRFGIRSIPTLLVFQNGRPVEKLVGAQGPDTIHRALDALR